MNNTIKRCAIYCRKSHEEGLDQAFNSLDAQREAISGYILSQRLNGWVALPRSYEDGGYSGSNTERPGLQELLRDIDDGKVDIVLVYKIDRLSRSLIDFTNLFAKFEEKGVSFVSVTQQIDTSTPAGRMMLNILMTFAQYEREVIAERIRDKMAASRKKGIWVGGAVPYGYKVVDRKLVVIPEYVSHVRHIYERYNAIPSFAQVAKELNNAHIRNSQGRLWDGQSVRRVLQSCIYAGYIPLKDELYEGEHEAIIPRDVWARTQELLKSRKHEYRKAAFRESDSLLKGILKCGHCGCPMYPVYSQRRGKQYTYYVCQEGAKDKRKCPIVRFPASEIEHFVIDELFNEIKTPTFKRLLLQTGVSSNTLDELLGNLPLMWDKLFPRERVQLIQNLIDRVVINKNGLDIILKTQGMQSLSKEIQ